MKFIWAFTETLLGIGMIGGFLATLIFAWGMPTTYGEAYKLIPALLLLTVGGLLLIIGGIRRGNK